jgi:hypothetical protein
VNWRCPTGTEKLGSLKMKMTASLQLSQASSELQVEHKLEISTLSAF